MKGAQAADAADEFLTDARAFVAAVERAREFAVVFRILFDVGVEQEQGDAPDLHGADFRVDRFVAELDLDHQDVSVLIAARLKRKISDVGVLIDFFLFAFGVNMLLEVPLVVEKPDRVEGNPQTARAFNVVAREDAKPARIDRDRFVKPEFKREVSDRARTENACVLLRPFGAFRDILLIVAERDVDARLKRKFKNALFEFFRRVFGQQGDRIVAQIAPAPGVEQFENLNDLRPPAPQKIVRELDAFIVRGHSGGAFAVFYHVEYSLCLTRGAQARELSES